MWVTTAIKYLTFDRYQRMSNLVYFSCKTTRISSGLQQWRKSFLEVNRSGITPAVDRTRQGRLLLAIDHDTWMARNENHSQCKSEDHTSFRELQPRAYFIPFYTYTSIFLLFDTTLKKPALVFKTHFNRQTNERSLFTSFPVNKNKYYLHKSRTGLLGFTFNYLNKISQKWWSSVGSILQ